MSKELFMGIVITASTTLVYVSYVPQIWRIWKRKSSEDVSKESWMLWVTAALLDTCYSIGLGNTGLIIYSITETVLTLAVLLLTLRYRRSTRHSLCVCGIDCTEFSSHWWVLCQIVDNLDTTDVLLNKIVDECDIICVIEQVAKTENVSCSESTRNKARNKAAELNVKRDAFLGYLCNRSVH